MRTGFAVAVLAYVVFLLLFSLTGFPDSLHSSARMPYLIDKPMGEDGFYLLTVAHNIAAQGHVLYNRGAVATGIQPLVTFVFAGLDLLIHDREGSSTALVRATLLLGGVLFIVFAAQMSRIARQLCSAEYRTPAATFTFLLILMDFTLFRLFTYGLETGVYLICVAACFSATVRIAQAQRTTLAEALRLGVAAGLAGEARIDFGVVFAVILGGLLLKRWISPVKALAAGGVALAIVSPWFLFLYRVSGSWMPSSGPAESSLISAVNVGRRVAYMFPALAGHLMPWVYGVKSSATMAAAAVSLLLPAAFLWRTRKHRLPLLAVTGRGVVLLWSAGFAVLTVIYFLLFDSTHFYYRYTSPLVIVTVPLLGIALAHAAWARRHSHAVALALMVVFAGWSVVSLHSGRIGNIQTVAAGYVLQNYPTTHVGAFQSGVVGYFNHNVENLDGKLNGPALAATKRHALADFIDREQIDVIVDWPDVIHAALPAAYLESVWQPCPVPMPITEAICLLRRTAAAR